MNQLCRAAGDADLTRRVERELWTRGCTSIDDFAASNDATINAVAFAATNDNLNRHDALIAANSIVAMLRARRTGDREASSAHTRCAASELIVSELTKGGNVERSERVAGTVVGDDGDLNLTAKPVYDDSSSSSSSSSSAPPVETPCAPSLKLKMTVGASAKKNAPVHASSDPSLAVLRRIVKDHKYYSRAVRKAIDISAPPDREPIVRKGQVIRFPPFFLTDGAGCHERIVGVVKTDAVRATTNSIVGDVVRSEGRWYIDVSIQRQRGSTSTATMCLHAQSVEDHCEILEKHDGERVLGELRSMMKDLCERAKYTPIARIIDRPDARIMLDILDIDGDRVFYVCFPKPALGFDAESGDPFSLLEVYQVSKDNPRYAKFVHNTSTLIFNATSGILREDKLRMSDTAMKVTSLGTHSAADVENIVADLATKVGRKTKAQHLFGAHFYAKIEVDDSAADQGEGVGAAAVPRKRRRPHAEVAPVPTRRSAADERNSQYFSESSRREDCPACRGKHRAHTCSPRVVRDPSHPRLAKRSKTRSGGSEEDAEQQQPAAEQKARHGVTEEEAAALLLNLF